jgi:hypothetical protein
MRFIVALLAGLALTTAVGAAAPDPVKIGVDGVLSGPNAERGRRPRPARRGRLRR